jgi:hypothetical protein
VQLPLEEVTALGVGAFRHWNCYFWRCLHLNEHSPSARQLLNLSLLKSVSLLFNQNLFSVKVGLAITVVLAHIKSVDKVPLIESFIGRIKCSSLLPQYFMTAIFTGAIPVTIFIFFVFWGAIKSTSKTTSCLHFKLFHNNHNY